MKDINKTYPAQIHRTVAEKELKDKKSDINKLFLYNKNIDALVYTYFLDLSYPVEVAEKTYETRVWKSDLPNQQSIADSCRISKSTYIRKLKVLKEEGYITEYDEYYLIEPQPQQAFIHIPLQTIKFFLDACNSNVIKTYLYLAQGYKYAKSIGKSYYTFTKEEIMKVIKLSTTHKEGQQVMTNILTTLENNGLIKCEEGYVGQKPVKKLVEFNFSYKKIN